MNKGKKIFFVLIALILGTFLFAVFVNYQFVHSLNFEFVKPEDYPIVGDYIPNYLYWGSIIGMAIILFIIFWIVLRPDDVTSIKISEDGGRLEIRKSAIVGLIQSQVSQSNLLNDSKVKVKMYKKNIKVRITGNVGNNVDVINQVNFLVRNIEVYIQKFIGLDTLVKVDVEFKNMTRSSNNKKSETRVI